MFVAVVALFSAAMVGNAQVKQYSNDLSAFKALVVTGEFEVTVVTGTMYNVLFTVDEPLREYLVCDISDQTLTIGLNEKGLPKEVKNLYKGRNATPATFKATVTVPEPLQAIRMTGKSVLYNTVDVASVYETTIEVTDNAVVKQLNLTAPKITIKADKRSYVLATISCDQAWVDMTGSSSMTLVQQNVSDVKVTLANAASIVTNGEAKNFILVAKGTSKGALNGMAEKATFDVSGSADINATNFNITEASVKMNSLSALSVAVKDELELESISGGATLNYSGDPAVRIKEIVKSTVNHK